MADNTQFGSASPGGLGLGRNCLPFEAMLADAVDGLLSPEDQLRFDDHLSTCEACSGMLEAATRGNAFLDLLRPFPPEPPPDLLGRILEQTSLQAARDAEAARLAAVSAREADSLLGRPAPAVAPSSAPAPFAAIVLPFSTRVQARLTARLRPAAQQFLQPRLAMTAAMAFFSIALTLNLTGVRLSQLHARDLRPGNLRRTFYETDARLVRYYESFRVVYELESRVRDLQQRSDAEGAPRPATQSPAPPPATSDKPQPASDPASSGNGQTAPSPDRPDEHSPRSSRDRAPRPADHTGASEGRETRGASAPHTPEPSSLDPSAGVLAAELHQTPLYVPECGSNPLRNGLQSTPFSTSGGLA